MGLFRASPAEPTAVDLATQDPEKHIEGTEALEDLPGTQTADHHVIDPELERAVKRKLDWNLVPLVTALYLLSFLDRSNIGNAKIAGMSKDLDLSGDRYDWYVLS